MTVLLASCASGSQPTLQLSGPAEPVDCTPGEGLCGTGLIPEVTQDFQVSGPGDDVIVECQWPPDPAVRAVKPDANGFIVYVLMGSLGDGTVKAGECTTAYGVIPDEFQPTVRVVNRSEMRPESSDQVVLYTPATPWAEP